MAFFEDLLKGATGSGAIAGLGAVLLAPVLLPVVGRAVRPVAKTMLKTGIEFYRGVADQIGPALTDLVDEARDEIAAGSASKTPVPAVAPTAAVAPHTAQRGSKRTAGS